MYVWSDKEVGRSSQGGHGVGERQAAVHHESQVFTRPVFTRRRHAQHRVTLRIPPRHPAIYRTGSAAA